MHLVSWAASLKLQGVRNAWDTGAAASADGKDDDDDDDDNGGFL